MTELIERLEKATGPDRELDLAIWAACGGSGGPDNGFLDWRPALTASIDAALDLVERKLPGAWWFAARQADEIGEYSFDLRASIGGLLGTASAPTLPLAICIALLRALSAQEQADGG